MSDKHDLSKPKTPFEYLRLFFSGFAMGSADIVPGVSGGTMAFILGVYETLINAIKSADITAIRMALKFDLKGLLDHIPFRFLIALGLGMLTAILALSTLLHDLLHDQPTYLFAFFGGLIIASILAIGAKVKWNMAATAALIVAAAFAFVLVGLEAGDEDPIIAFIDAVELNEDTTERQASLLADLEAAGVADASDQLAVLAAGVSAGENVDVLAESLTAALEANYQPSDPVTLFFSGMIAICAMILPGISGSFILLIMGQYAAVLGAVKNLDILSVAAVGAGAAIGIIAFSRVISWLLKHYENVTIAALTGFMLGSLRLIWTEAADGVRRINDTGVLAGDQIALALGLLLGGFLLVSLMDHLQSRTNPVFALVWRPRPAVDDIAEKASALE